jgi:hypothetical protein
VSDRKPTDVKLESLSFWPRDAVRRLSERWIDSAAQVVSAAATKTGMDGLSTETGLPQAEVEELVERTKLELGPAADALGSPVDTSRMGLGAIRPPKAR